MESSRYGLDRETLKRDLQQEIETAFKSSGAGHRLGPAHSLKHLYDLASAVGQQPPQPSTFRASIGAVLVRLVRRALFWYSPQITRFQIAAATEIEKHDAAITSQRALIERLDSAFDSRDSLFRKQRDVLDRHDSILESQTSDLVKYKAAVSEQQSALESHQKALDEQKLALQNETLQLRAQLEELTRDIHALRADAHGIRSELAQVQDRIGRLEEQLTSQENAFRDSQRHAFRIRAQTAAQERRLSLLIEEVRKRMPGPLDAIHMKTIEQEENHLLDSLYLNFEDEFRGSRDEIRSRLKVYLPLIQERGLGTGDMPIVDLGCGRGEWLELLRDNGLAARGIDNNRAMVEQCREIGLDVSEDDLMRHLRGLPDSSVGMLTLFHVLEHLPVPVLLEALDQCVRVLKPGGAALFETPNPENILVGAHTFYTDLTHRSPLPPSTLQFLAEARGLCQVEVWRLNPYPGHFKVPELSEIDKRFNSLFYGPRDYAVIGRKAA